MNLNVRFEENKATFKTDFGEVHNVSDGGYERGYTDGEKVGYNNGYTEGETKGFENGKSEGIEEGYNNGLEVGMAQGIKQGYTEGYTKGMFPSYYIGCLAYLYYNVVFPENSELDLRLANLVRADCSCTINGTKNLKRFALDIESSDVESINLSQFARDNKDIEIIDFSNFNVKINLVSYFALQATRLKSVYGALDLSPCTGAINWLNGATALEDIEFVPNTIKISIDFHWCTKLSHDSLMSIINALADKTPKISGSWKVHDNIIGDIYELYGGRLSFSVEGEDAIFDLLDLGSDSYAMDGDTGYRVELRGKTVDFGTTPQTISNQVVSWFSQNATSQGGTIEGGGTFTVTLGATNLAKLTNTEKARATQKGWTLA